MDRPGRIVVSTRYMASADRVVASVADNGPGVPPRLRARIFEPFFTTKSIGDGTGVGLALCHRIVSAHGGTIEIGRSAEGGALFSVSLPATLDAEIDPSVEYGAPIAGLRALVVEDEAEVAEIVADILGTIGIETVHARSADRALTRLAADDGFDVILSDLRMPGLSGRAFLEAIEQRWPHLTSRVAFITGDAMGADAAAIRDGPGHPLLEKPIAPRDLRALIRNVLSSQSAGES